MRLSLREAAVAVLCLVALSPCFAQTSLPPEVELGRSWLSAQIAADGRLAATSLQLATEPQSEAEVIETLQFLGGAPAALVQRQAARGADVGVEHLARQIIAQARAGKLVGQLLTELRSQQNADGGFGGAVAYQSTVLDTSFALVAFRVAGVAEGQDISRAVNYLVSRVADPASSDWQMSALAKPYVSAYALLALQMHSARFPIAAAVTAQRDALIAQQGNGVYAEVLLDTVAALALQFTTTGGTGLTDLRTAIRAAQAPDGSWQGDSFLTALALRALASEVIAPPSVDGNVVLRVRDGVTLAFLQGVTVTVQELPSLALQTGADGRVDTGPLAAGTYHLALSRDGFRSRDLGAITVSAGQTRDLGLIDLLRDANVAVVFGRVTDVATTNPLAGVDIAVSGAVQASAQTAPDGSFELVFATAGDIQISAGRAGYQTASGTGALVLGQSLRFSPALFADGGQVPTSASLLAMIVDATTELPLSGVSVTVGAATAVSDVAGVVQLTELPAGAFTATLSKAGYLGAQLSGSLVAGVNDAGVIRLQPQNLDTRSTLSGRVADAGNGVPIGGATVAISGTNLRATTATDGRYTIANITGLPFTAVATAPGYGSQQVATGDGQSGNFQADFALTKLAAANVSLDSVTMSAPEFDPFSEVGVLGTVTNLSADSEIGLIFNAIVSDAGGKVIRDVPNVQSTLNRTFDDTIIRFAPGETKPITIIWGSLNDAPGDYTALFRGATPDGRVVLEGTASYRVRAVTRLDGGIITDPPLIQAGTGQSVALSADLTNMGNQIIPAGDVKLSIKLVAQDDRPPLPPKPTFTGTLISGTPLSRPTGITRDAAGNLYTLNTSPVQLVKVLPDGSGAVLRALPTVSSTNASLSTPLSVSWRAPNLLRIAWITGWTADLDLDNGNAISNFKAPPTGIQASSVTAYTFDPASGNEYFGATQSSRPRVLMRDPAGQVSVLVDAGLTSAGESQFGPDGKLYVVNNNPGAVFRIDPIDGAIEPFWIGLISPQGMAIAADGSIYVGTSSPQGVLRRRPDGLTETFARTSGATIVDLKFGRDGLLYGVASDGSIRRFAADGSNTVFARGIINFVSGVAVDEQQGIYAYSSSTLRFRSDATGIVSLGSGTQSVLDLMPDGPQGPLIANGTSLLRAVGAGFQTLLTPANHNIRAIAPLGSDVLLGALDGTRAVLARSDRNSFTPIAASPFSSTVRKLVAESAQSLLVLNNDSVVRLNGDGTHALVARSISPFATAFDRASGALWVNSSVEGLLRIDLATGVKTRRRGFVSGMSSGADISADGALVYTDAGARKLVRYDPLTDTFSDFRLFPTSLQPLDVAIAPEGSVFVRFSDSSLRRLDGVDLTTIDTSVTELTVRADGQVGYRKNEKLFAAPLPGGTATLISVMVETPSLAAWLDSDTIAAYFIGRSQLRLLTVAGAVVRDVFGFADFSAMAATASGDIFVLDSNKNLNRVSDGAVSRVGRFVAATDLKTLGDEVFVLTGDGLFRLRTDATLEPALTVPGWSAGQYGGFDITANAVVLFNRTTSEIVLVEADAVTERYQSFANPSSLVQKPDGNWLVGSSSRIVEVTPGADQSRLFSPLTGTRDLFVRADGSIVASTNTDIVQMFDADGIPSIVTGVIDSTAIRISSLSEMGNGGGLFAASFQGVIYRQQGDFLRPFAAGVAQLNTILPLADGDLLLSGEASPVILAYRSGKVTSVGNLVEGPRSLCALDADTVATVGRSFLSILDIGTNTNLVAVPVGVNPLALACVGDGAIRVLSNSSNRIDRAEAGTQQVGLRVGDVVHEQVLPMRELGLEGNQHLALDPWLPPAGGDYEIDLKPLAPAVEGSLLSGIHVGSAASAIMTATPDSAAPGESSVQIDTRLEGADFTRLARIDRAQLQLAGDSIFPAAMSLDPSGQLWFSTGSALFRVPLGSTTATRVGSFTTTGFRGELPIDSLGRAYYVPFLSGKYELRRTDETGVNVRLTDFGDVRVTSMTIDAQDRLYVLTSDNKVRLVLPDGSQSPYVDLPPEQPPFGITRDGVGGIYVQQSGNRILYVSPTREVEVLDLRGASFEYEGVNIAGDCGESVFMTPMVLPGTAQSGEEHTVLQLVGRTGEIGTIISGRTISQDLLDMDFITYDRFGSRLLIMSESNGRKLFTVPVTCGAIDMDLHIVLPSGQPVFAMDPVASSVFTRDNGDVEYVWNLRDVNKQGLTISLSSQLRELMRTQDRPVAKEAFVLLKNSFRPEPVRLNIDIPSVHVRDLVDIAVALDREEYPQQSAVAIRVPMNNLDNVDKSGALVVRVEDANGALVDTLVERQQAFGPLETIELTPPFNTGALRVGDYRVVAEIRDALGGLVAQASDDFRVVAGSGSGPTLISAVATDQPVYLVGSAAQILASVENQSGNAGFVGLLVSERVTASNGTVVFDGSLPLTNLEPSAQARLTFALSLAGLSSGFYDVYQEVRSADGALLDNRATRFEVQSIAGTAALTGALALDPLHVRRGNALGIAATLRNRGDAAVSGAESVIRVLLPGSNTALAEWVLPHDLAAGASVDIPASFDTANRDLRDYLVVLSARVNGQEAVLAQKPFWIDDVVFAGELTAAPADVTQGNDVVLSGAVRNIGTLAAPGSDIALRVEDATTGALVREWHVPADVAAGAQQDVSQTLNTLALPIGAYMARLSVTFEGNERPLAQADFVVRNFRIAGTFAATPVQVNRGEPVDLLGTVSNSGNLGIDPLPLRIEVVKVDTLTSVLSLDDSIALAEQGSFPMRRVADTTGFAAGQYEGVFSAFFNGEWHELARDGFEVVRAVEVELHMEVPRDARVLVLMSCSPSEDDHGDDEHDRTAGGTSNHDDDDDDDEDEDEEDDSSCAETRQQFLSQYLSERGIEHRIVLDQDSFMDELRCGRYNVFWLSGDSVKLGTAEAIELRESIYRGDGFIADGSHDERNSQLDEMLGVNFRGHHSTQDMGVTGTAALFPAVTVPSYGQALKLELTTGTLEAAFAPVNAPAIVSASYGQGRALTYGFDLIDSLLRDGTQPATERLLLNALVHVAPQSAPASYAIGSYTPVTTMVQNLGVAVDARLETEVDAPTAIVSSSPQATTGDVLGSAWDFNLPEGEHRSFDVNVVTGNTAPAQVRSSVFERAAGGLLPLGNAQIELAASDAAAAADALLASLRSASLRGGEASARNRAVKAIEEARAAEAQDDTEEAIDQWLKASDEVRHIQSVSHAEWRLAIARLLAVSQHLGCKLAFKLCGTQPTTAMAFEASAFVPLQSLGRVQSGGKNAWEWQLGDRGDATPGLRIDLDWRKKQAARFVLNVDAAGKGRLELRQGNSVKAVVQTDPAVDGALARGDALQWVVRAGSGHEHARFKLTGFTINGESVAAELESEDDDAASQARLTWYKPAMRAALTLDGVLELEFDDEVPQGAQLELELRAGNLQCNGGTP